MARMLGVCPLVLAFPFLSARAETKILRVAPQSDIVLLDPVFGTATISRAQR